MPKKTVESETVTFSVTISSQANQMLLDLVGTGLFGTSRGEIARTLINQRLTGLVGEGILSTKRKGE